MIKSKNDSLLLEIKNLYVDFKLSEGVVHAVNGINMKINRGEVFGVAGESGCGKSITAQSLMQIITLPGKITQGEINFRKTNGEWVNIAALSPKSSAIRKIRGREIAMIFQEPMSSFSALYTIGNQLNEGIMLHQKVKQGKAKEIVIEMLNKVGIPNPEKRINQYPFQFSGGMRQRAMIAMALSCQPSLLIADEPTTALDVTIQAQILNLLKVVKEESNTAIMFITHNLGVLAQIADRICIMYLGKIIEEGTVQDIFDYPKHPYTIKLLGAIPKFGLRDNNLVSIRGSVPGPFESINGCAFHPRCTECMPVLCEQQVPPEIRVSDQHTVSCWLYTGESKKSDFEVIE